MDSEKRNFEISGYLLRLDYFNQDCLSVSVINSLDIDPLYKNTYKDSLILDYIALCREFNNLVDTCPRLKDLFLVH